MSDTMAKFNPKDTDGKGTLGGGGIALQEATSPLVSPSAADAQPAAAEPASPLI